MTEKEEGMTVFDYNLLNLFYFFYRFIYLFTYLFIYYHCYFIFPTAEITAQLMCEIS